MQDRMATNNWHDDVLEYLVAGIVISKCGSWEWIILGSQRQSSSSLEELRSIRMMRTERRVQMDRLSCPEELR